MDRLRQDVRYSFRSLKKSWPVTLLVVGSLALAIAGNTIVYSLINGLLYRPLPYEEPDRLMIVSERVPGTPAGFVNPASAANWLDWRERQTTMVDLAGFQPQPMGLDAGGDEQVPISTARVSPSFFSLLGVQPFLGRDFADEEALLGKHRVLILDHGYWVEEHGADRGIVGETLKLNGEPYEVVGVLPEEFEFLDPNTQIWVPLALDRYNLRRHERSLIAFGRLKDGVTETQAEAEMATVSAQLREEYPDANRGFVVEVLNLREEIPDPQNRLFFKMLQGAMLFVILIACANIANLLMARSQKREREIALRRSLGAGRGQIVRQLLTESLVMALLAGVIGLGLGYLGIQQMARAMASSLPAIYSPVLDLRVFLYTLAVTVAGGLLFGLAPVLQTRGVDLVSALKEGTSGAGAGGGKRWASKLLVVGELTLALVFLGGSGILLQSFDTLQNQDAGFETENLLTLQMQFPATRYTSDEERVGALDLLEERLGALAGVEDVLVSNTLPRSIFVPQDALVVDSNPPPPDQAAPQVSYVTANPGYFDALGIRREEGRVFREADGPGAPPVAVVNRAAAERFFGDDDPLGETVTLLAESWRIVGVVHDVRHTLSVGREFTPTVYLPWAQQPLGNVAITLSTRVDPESLTRPVRQAIHGLDPGFAITEVRTLDAVIEQFWAGQKVISALLVGFGALALFLAAVGTYGVLAYSVALRTREIGLRMALGARRREVIVMVMRQGLVLGVVGLALGIPGVLLVKKLIEQVMAGFVPVEMVAMGGAVAVMVGVILLASFLPARRAASVDPLEALRWE